MPDAFVSFDAELRYTYVNGNAERLQQARREDLLGKDVRALYPDAESRKTIALYERALREQRPLTGTSYHAGFGRWVEVRAFPTPDGVSVFYKDVSAQVMAEAAQREGEQQFRVLIENLQSAVALIDERGAFVLVNGSFRRLFEIPPEADILNVNSRDWGRWEVLDERGALLAVDEHPVRKAALTRSAVKNQLVAVRSPSGPDLRWLLVSAEPVLDAQGGIHRLICTYYDITARKVAEERHRRLVEELADGLFVADAEGRYTDVNPAGCALFGRTREEVLASTLLDVLDPSEHGRLPEAIASFADGRVHRSEWLYRRKDGSTFLGELDGRRLPGGGFQGILRDVTERRRAQAALLASERAARMRAELVEHAPVLVRDLDDRITAWNEGSRRLFGFTREEALGAVSHALLRTRFPAPLEAIRAQLARDGRWEGELRHRRADGAELVVATQWILHRDAAGQPAAVVEVNTDVTERVRAEEALRSANALLTDANRQKTEFLAVLSHELRNPLAPIRNSTYLLEHAAAGSAEARRAREVIRRQTEHLTRLVDDLLDITRISRGKVELQRRRVDLRDVVRKSMDDARSLFERAGVELRLEHAVGPVWIDADPTRIAQVIGNILHNAQKFTPSGGIVTVRLAVGDGRVRLQVRDTGIGMEPGREEAMFEPFAQGAQGIARTRGGLGLGLALVRSLVELHGGAASARSEGSGHGTELTIVLPLAEGGHQDDRAPAARGSRGREILIIEDNADAAQTLADVLALEGHEVRVASDGRAGIAAARERRPEVVLCDVGLPDVSGYEVARALRADPALRGVRLVALTGYAQPEDRRRAEEAGFDAHLAKPPALEALQALLRGREGDGAG
jgi:PAS domain S-box-containing protein